MIERYTKREIAKIWEPENKFRKWLQVEILACEVWARLGKIPQKALNNIKAKADFDIKRIDEIEKTVKHDVISFLTSVAEFVGPDSRYIHRGLTSSDILDTSLEKIAVEIRHLQRTEVLEAEEPFTEGQKGSSAMPHKRNPVLSENLTG